ncbi:hypothetical protein EOD39_13749 [Acipenser ruthenus]|uniref:Uncharacterized protein n=1 Tax=Acipenser ruthenus TaxID=7906 RepID=A0A662YNG5_ACIRT|nr:hypothetical protein EOD39_13749 [Acipenser ruthenus]
MLDLKPGRSCKRGWETLPPAFPCRLGSQSGSSICGRSLVAVGRRSLLTAGAIVGRRHLWLCPLLMTAGLIGHYDPARAAGAGHGVATVTIAGLLPCQVKLGGQLVYLLDELWNDPDRPF